MSGQLVQLRYPGKPDTEHQPHAPKATRDSLFAPSAKPGGRSAFARATIAVTSGKGGVGKSTVAVNLAVGLAQRGLTVGLLDADVYGPSAARMLSLHEDQLRWNDANQMVPAENYGVRMVSTALAAGEPDAPLAWRSSVATRALVQLLDDVAWGPLDVLVVDLPPGTGDVQLTVAQETTLALAVVVTTPQTVATDDVARALRMLRELDVSCVLVENMSWFDAPDTGVRYHPFGRGGGARLAERYLVPLLAELPLRPEVLEAGDEGRPAVVSDDEAVSGPWQQLAALVQEQPAVQARLATREAKR